MSPKPDREIDDELRFHIEQQAQEFVAAGMTPPEARRKAVVAFGGVESVRTLSYEQRTKVVKIGKPQRHNPANGVNCPRGRSA
jgi:hypothetical protein